MSFLETVFGLVLANSVRVTLLLILFFALRRGLRLWVPASAVYAGWILIAARLLVPAGLATTWSPYNLFSAAKPVAGAQFVGTPRPAPTAAAPVGDISVLPTASESTRRIVDATLRRPVPWIQAAAVGWLVVALGLLARRFMAGALFRRRVRRAEVATEARMLQIVADCSAAEGLPQPIRVLSTEAVSTPALFGALRPTLLLPPGVAARLTDGELRLVIRHELAHCRRGDLLSKALLEVAVIAHWFNPAVGIALRAARLDCELACDERVLRGASPECRTDYGATLLKVLRLDAAVPPLSGALGILKDREQFKQRIHMILSHQKTGLAQLLSGGAMLVLVAAIAVTQESEVRAGEATPAAPVAPVAPAKPPQTAGVAELEPASRHQIEQMLAKLTAEMEALRATLDAKSLQLAELQTKLGMTPAALGVDRARIDSLGASDEAMAKQREVLQQALAVRDIDQRRTEEAMRVVRDQVAKVRAETAQLAGQRALDEAQRQLVETQAEAERIARFQQDQANADRAFAAARAAEQARIDAEAQRAAVERERAAMKAQMAQPTAP